MIYEVILEEEAKNHITKHNLAGDKKLLKKIHSILQELKEHPEEGIGHPEQLKHYIIPTWSRRISEKHRLVYEIHEDIRTVFILATYGHYNDK